MRILQTTPKQLIGNDWATAHSPTQGTRTPAWELLLQANVASSGFSVWVRVRLREKGHRIVNGCLGHVLQESLMVFGCWFFCCFLLSLFCYFREEKESPPPPPHAGYEKVQYLYMYLWLYLLSACCSIFIFLFDVNTIKHCNHFQSQPRFAAAAWFNFIWLKMDGKKNGVWISW